MTGLIIKDWKLFRHQGRYYGMVIILALAMVFVGSKDFTSFITSYLTFMISMYALSSFNYDEYDNGMAFLIALPSGRKEYVRAKYGFSILLVFGGWLLGTLIRMIFFLLRFSAAEYAEIIAEEPVYLIIVLIYLGCTFPFLIKYGAEKGRNIAFIILAVLILGIFLLSRLEIPFPVFNLFFQMLENAPLAVLPLMMGACVLILGISYRISLEIIKKKEF